MVRGLRFSGAGGRGAVFFGGGQGGLRRPPDSSVSTAATKAVVRRNLVIVGLSGPGGGSNESRGVGWLVKHRADNELAACNTLAITSKASLQKHKGKHL